VAASHRRSPKRGRLEEQPCCGKPWAN
jgi:hypothetical protein